MDEELSPGICSLVGPQSVKLVARYMQSAFAEEITSEQFRELTRVGQLCTEDLVLLDIYQASTKELYNNSFILSRGQIYFTKIILFHTSSTVIIERILGIAIWKQCSNFSVRDLHTVTVCIVP